MTKDTRDLLKYTNISDSKANIDDLFKTENEE